MKYFNNWIEAKRAIISNKDTKEYDYIISEVISKLDLDIPLPKGSTFYRSRLIEIKNINPHDVFQGYDEEGSMAPRPVDVKEIGRFNMKKESVLYIAEDKYTTMAEQRMGKRMFVSIAEIELKEDLKIVNLEYSDMTDKKTDLEQIYSDITLDCYLVVNENYKLYNVTNYIAKRIKEFGYDGIKYSSSLSEKGSNIVIFNPKKARAINSKVYQNLSVLYYGIELLPCSETMQERLIPKSITNTFKDTEIDWFFNKIK